MQLQPGAIVVQRIYKYASEYMGSTKKLMVMMTMIMMMRLPKLWLEVEALQRSPLSKSSRGQVLENRLRSILNGQSLEGQTANSSFLPWSKIRAHGEVF